VDSTVINLKANPNYHSHKPYISNFRIELFQSSSDMIDALVRKQIDGVSGVLPEDVATVNKIQGVNDFRVGLPAYVGAFFNLKSPVFADLKTRQAFAYAIDREAIVRDSLKGEASISYYPIPAGFTGFNPLAQKLQYDEQKAKDLYGQSGVGKTNLRIVTLDNPIYKTVALSLAESWKKLGINVEIITADNVQLQQNYIRSRNYDVLLYGQNIGLDSDVYSFWHSSQATDPGLNVSGYKNSEVDQLLEAGRLAKDSGYKASRYSAFVEKWANDVPAIILYSPYYNYAQTDRVIGFDAKKIAEPSNRFYNVYDWYFSDL
jgi:peptide/nickel transport system substrate-binding protein